jgi:hypothetical protein
MILDRTLSYKLHLEKTEMKVNSRVNLVRKLSGTKWGSGAHTSRTACKAMRLITGTVKYMEYRVYSTSMAPSSEQHCAA